MNTLTIYPNDRIYRFQFNSLEEFAIAARDRTSVMQDSYRSSRNASKAHEEWSAATFDEAVNFALKGWPNGGLLYKKYNHLVPQGLLDKLLPAQEFATRWEHDVAGSMIDMSLAARDIGPAQFITEVEDNFEVRRGKNMQRIVLNGVAAWDCPPEVIITRGVLAYSAVDHIETLGYSVELSVEVTIRGHSANGRSQYLTTFVRIKNFGEQLNLDRLMFALACPAFLRRLCFSLWETLPDKHRSTFSIGATYGTCAGVATRQKPGTLVLDLWDLRDVESTVNKFSEEIKLHYLNQDVEFDEESKEIK